MEIDKFIEFLNDKMPSSITDNEEFLNIMGVEKHDGIVRKKNGREGIGYEFEGSEQVIYIEINSFYYILFEEWD
jgi:hypothetical protein